MSTQTFVLPDVGEGLTETEIVQWRVAPGDEVGVNDVLVEIETAKSLVELPSPFAGTVGDLLAKEGETVEVGAPIITIADPAAAAAFAACRGEAVCRPSARQKHHRDLHGFKQQQQQRIQRGDRRTRTAAVRGRRWHASRCTFTSTAAAGTPRYGTFTVHLPPACLEAGTGGRREAGGPVVCTHAHTAAAADGCE